MEHRYNVVMKGDEAFLLSNSSMKIMTALKKNKDGLNYEALAKSTKLDKGSLYVFAGRLRKRKLVKTIKVDGDTLVALTKPIEVPKTKYVG